MSIILPQNSKIKPPLWPIDLGIITHNCAQLGLPGPGEGLELAMPMWEGVGRDVFDFIPQRMYPFTGTITWTANNIDFGTATDCYIDLSNLQLNTTKPFTIAFAYKMNAASAVNALFTLKTNTSQPFSAFIYNDANYYPICFGSSADWVTFRPSENFWSDWTKNFQTIVITFDGVDHTATSSYKVYYNGINKALIGTGGFNGTGQENRIGRFGNSAHYAKGIFKYFYVWPEKALNTLQAQILHNNNFGMFEPIRSPALWSFPLGPTTSAPTSVAPTTLPPTTLPPTSLPPTTLAPTSLAPTSLAPTTLPPTSLAPTSLAPTTLAPTSLAPTTLAPTTILPTTLQPTTLAPTSLPPTTVLPTTLPPTTLLPTTLAPTTITPTSLPPTTLWQSTAGPTTKPPTTTVAPTTLAPTTLAPTSLAPTTLLPTTLAPTTIAPTTLAITTLAPTTLGPTVPPTTGLPKEICIKTCNSIMIDNILCNSIITKELICYGNLC